MDEREGTGGEENSYETMAAVQTEPYGAPATGRGGVFICSPTEGKLLFTHRVVHEFLLHLFVIT